MWYVKCLFDVGEVLVCINSSCPILACETCTYLLEYRFHIGVEY